MGVRDKTHAEILAEIAHQVVEEHRDIEPTEWGCADEHDPSIDPSWFYRDPVRG